MFEMKKMIKNRKLNGFFMIILMFLSPFLCELVCLCFFPTWEYFLIFQAVPPYKATYPQLGIYIRKTIRIISLLICFASQCRHPRIRVRRQMCFSIRRCPSRNTRLPMRLLLAVGNCTYLEWWVSASSDQLVSSCRSQTWPL